MSFNTQALAPLFLIIIPFLFVVSSAAVYRSIYPEEKVKRALEIIAEYRVAKEEAKRRKRAAKKVRALEPQYKRARRLLLNTVLVKTLLLLLTYLGGSIMFIQTMPAIASPYHIPPLTVNNGDICVIPSIIIFFLAYIVFYTAYRDNFL
ncbi:MAG: hypothetical protein F7C35_08480 [Desulfurococcales archaeon]|nr:hypothetical protein [Desulfurococcales archaeon]